MWEKGAEAIGLTAVVLICLTCFTLVGFFAWGLVYPIWYHATAGRWDAALYTLIVIVVIFGFRAVITQTLGRLLRH